MSLISTWLSGLQGYLRDFYDQQLQWRLSRHDNVTALRQARLIAEQQLVAQLKKQAQQLAHELEVMKTRNNTELAMVKTQCQQDLKDYQQYLHSLDKLKDTLRNSYEHLPEAVAFTIHHHAKQLLNQMWEAQGPQEKLKSEIQLLQFMTAVHEDSQLCLQGGEAVAMPNRALACIDADLEK